MHHPTLTAAIDSATPLSVAAQVMKASELGCALDVNLDTGASFAGAATDDTALLNAFLATASATNPIVLVIDGAALIKGLRLSPAGYTTIQGAGEATGFFMAQGANNDGIHNRPAGYVNDPGPPVPYRRAQHVSLLNFRLNGNRGDGHTGNSTNGSAHGAPWLFGINLMDMEQITIDQVTVFHAPTYSMRLSNVGHATITRCRLAPFGPAEAVQWTNTDGIHVNGPSNDITIRDCYFRTGDDGIALNAPEGHSGDIVRVSASNCYFDGCQVMMRFYSGSRVAALVSDVTVERFTGTANVVCFMFGLDDAGVLTVPQALRNIVIRDSQVTGSTVGFLQDNLRELTLENVAWTGTGTQYGMLTSAHHALAIGTITLKNCTIERTGASHGALCVLDMRGIALGEYPVHMGRLVIDGLQCSNNSLPMESLVLMSAGSRIGTIDVEAANARGIPRIVPDSQWPQVGFVAGAGLLHSGWSVPDGKARDGVAYLSDEAQIASVNLNGNAHTLLHSG